MSDEPKGGWDEADTVTSFDEPVMSSKPPVPPTREMQRGGRPVPTTGSSREEIWAIVRAQVEEATIPLVQRMRDLELRLEKAEQIAREVPPVVSTLKSPGTKKASPVVSLPPPTVSVHVDLPVGYDGGKRKKMLAKVVVGALLLLVLVVVIASAASQG